MLVKEGVFVQVRLISEFVSYGTTSLLEDSLLELIQPDLTQALTALEVSLQLHIKDCDLDMIILFHCCHKAVLIFDDFESTSHNEFNLATENFNLLCCGWFRFSQRTCRNTQNGV